MFFPVPTPISSTRGPCTRSQSIVRHCWKPRVSRAFPGGHRCQLSGRSRCVSTALLVLGFLSLVQSFHIPPFPTLFNAVLSSGRETVRYASFLSRLLFRRAQAALAGR